MTTTYPALLHFAVVWRERLLLVKADAGRGHMYWDLPYGACFQRPTERHVEMVLGQTVPRISIDKIAIIDLPADSEGAKVFLDGGIYRCDASNVQCPDPDRVLLADGSQSSSPFISIRAQIALSLYTQSRP